MAKFLTTAAVAKYKATGRRRIIRDSAARSLYLIVQPSGSKSFAMRFRRPGGKAGKLTLGPVDFSGVEATEAPIIGQPLTLSAARQLAATVHRNRMLGHDVIADHKTAKKRRRVVLAEVGTNSFGQLARQFVIEYAKVKIRRWQTTARLLGLDHNSLEPLPGGLAERWADRDIKSLDGHAVHTLVDEVKRLGVPGLAVYRGGISNSRARVFHTTLSSMLGWCLEQRRISSNPCVGVHKPKTAAARDRVLANAELTSFWQAATDIGGPFGSVVKLLLLTGCRLNEIAGMRWNELSDDGTQLNLPGARTKNKRAHAIPLSPLARSIIAGMPRIVNSPFVFTFSGTAPVSGWTKLKSRLDAEMKISAWKLHDLRRTAVTGMVDLGVRPDVVELVVNHVSGSRSGVAGVYNRSELMPERRAALERWAQHVAGLVGGQPDNVVTLRAGV